jgi:Zn-dependent peptidase ImmA (M78 family)
MPKREWHEPLVKRLIDDHGGADPERIIEDYADQLRAVADQHVLPIRPDIIASCHGIRRRRGVYDFAGRIFAEPNGQLVMDINAHDSDERQHFTEAHELIHPAFPSFTQDKRYRLDATMDRHAENREEEYLCDLGAAALLMPAELVAHEYTVRGGLGDVERLSRDAEVSIEAAANRVVSLAEEPAVLLCLTWSHKPADRTALRKGRDVPEALRVRYGVSAHLNLYIPKFKSCAHDSVFCLAAQSTDIESAVSTLPGVESAGRFRIEAKRYGTGRLERVLAIARPTA